MTASDRFSIIYSSIKPFLDIGILWFIIYKAYSIFVKTQGAQIIKVLITLTMGYAVAILLNLTTLLWIINTIAPVLLICFAVVFQPEMRKIFLRLGQGSWFQLGTRANKTYVDSILLAAEQLSKQKRGMLVVFARKTNLDDIIDSGVKLNAEISSSLLVTIFMTDTPLHDGAVIIQNGKVLAAGCFLPLSEQRDIKKTFGTRHRASIGVTEETDAVVLVVSEETGAISLAYDSKLYYDLTIEQITKTLESTLNLQSSETIEDENATEYVSKA